MVRDNVFGSVAVVGVEVPNRHAFRSVFQGIERRHGDVAKVTKTHGAITGGVMAGRSHQTEGALAAQRRSCHIHGSTGRAGGVLVDAGDCGGVRVEVLYRLFYPLDMLRAVSA